MDLRILKIRAKIEKIVDAIMEALKNNDNKLFLCVIGTAQFLNYYIEKGIILPSDKNDIAVHVLTYIDEKYFHYMPTPDFLKSQLTSIMMDQKGYEYEKLISPILKQIERLPT